MKTKISYEEWVSEVKRASNCGTPGTFTTTELREKTGICVSNASYKIRELIRAGKVVFAGKVPRVAIDGKMTRVPCYRFVK
jgi:hypothetical protein